MRNSSSDVTHVLTGVELPSRPKPWPKMASVFFQRHLDGTSSPTCTAVQDANVDNPEYGRSAPECQAHAGSALSPAKGMPNEASAGSDAAAFLNSKMGSASEASTTPVGKKRHVEAQTAKKALPKRRRAGLSSAGQLPTVNGRRSVVDGKSARAARGTAGTFNGRRPPKDPVKRHLFDIAKQEHYLSRWVAQTRQKQNADKGKGQRTLSDNQKRYYDFMKVAMGKLAQNGVLGADRMRQAAALWKQQRSEPDATQAT